MTTREGIKIAEIKNWVDSNHDGGNPRKFYEKGIILKNELKQIKKSKYYKTKDDEIELDLLEEEINKFLNSLWSGMTEFSKWDNRNDDFVECYCQFDGEEKCICKKAIVSNE